MRYTLIVSPRPLSTSLSRFSSRLGMFTALSLACAGSSHAQSSWDAGSAANFDWNVAANWSGDTIPTANSDVLFDTSFPNPGGLFSPETITLGAGSQSKSLTFRDYYFLNGGTLTVTGGTITVAPNIIATINSSITANNLTLLGDAGQPGGILVLGGINSLTGETSVATGTLQVNDLGALGTSTVKISRVGADSGIVSFQTGGGNVNNNVILDGGTLRNEAANQITFTGGKTINVAANSTVDVTVQGATGKILLSAGHLTSASGAVTLTKMGAGTFQLAGNNPGFSGAFSIEGGQVEAQSVNALGDNSPTNLITIKPGGELVSSGIKIDHKITLDGGTISANANANANYAGDITLASDSFAQLRFFQSTGTGNSFRIGGRLLGSGTLTVSSPNPQTLTLSGNNAGSGFTGSVRPIANSTVVIESQSSAVPITLAGGSVRPLNVNAPNTVSNMGVAGFNARYFNLTSNPAQTTNVNYAVPPFAMRIDQTIDTPNNGSGYVPAAVVPGLNFTNVAALWSGLIHIPVPAGGTADDLVDYTFQTSSDDGTQLYIDGKLVVSHDGGHGFTSMSGTIKLKPGAHEIAYRYYQGTGGGGAKLEYSGPDTNGVLEVVGSRAGTVTNGKLAAIDGGNFPITVETGTLSAFDAALDTNFSGPITLQSGSGLRVTSPTLSTATFNGPVTMQGDATLAGDTGAAVFNTPITGGGAGTTLTVTGPYITTFNAKNTYAGMTNVIGAQIPNRPSGEMSGQLFLNASAGDAIPGNLIIGAGGTVSLLRGEQIANNAIVDVSGGTLNLGSNAESVANLALQNNGTVIGSGTLTLPNGASPQFVSGTLGAPLAGTNLAINKSSSETVTFAALNTYTGATTISGGQLIVSGVGNLGASGAGNGTVISGSGELGFANGAIVLGENLTINRSGISLRNISGINAFNGPITLNANGEIALDGGILTVGDVTASNKGLTVSGSGHLALGGVVNLGGGTFTKTSTGALIHNVDAATQVSLNVGAIAGKQVFNGPQTFSANTIASGNTWQFNSPASIPGTGQTITIAAGGVMQPGYAIDQSFLSRINPTSAGKVALTTNSANDLDFAALGLNIPLGTTGEFMFSGNLVPNGNLYRLDGSGGRLTVTSALGGAGNSMIITGNVNLFGKSTFGGTGSTVTIGAGAEVIALNNSAFGDDANTLKLDGGTLRFFNQTNSTVGFGSGHGRITRQIEIGAAGGTINIPSQNIVAFNSVNALIGTGTLTKTGTGEFQLVAANDFAGKIVVGPNGGVFDVRAGGRMTGVTEITVNAGSTFRLNNNDGVALFGVTNDGNRLNDAAVINLRGGTFNFTAQNSSTEANITETVGTINIKEGLSGLNVERRGGGGSTLTINTLNRDFGAFVRFAGQTNTLGATGDNSRIQINNWQMNGTAIAAPSGFVGGWATLQSTDFLAYNGTTLVSATYTTVNGTETPAALNNLLKATNVINVAGGDVTIGSLGTPASFEVGALRLADAATRQLLFANFDDRLYIVGGGILGQDANNAKVIGDAFNRGVITAGPSTGNTVPRELFLLQQQNSLTINSTIVDNNNQPVTLIKALDGTVILDSPDNLFSGGANIWRGTLQVNQFGGLGSGPVVVSGGRLQLQSPGTRQPSVGNPNLAPIEVKNGGEVFLNNSAGFFSNDGEKFIVRIGSSIMGNNNGSADVGINSLTRVSGTPQVGGDVFLEAGAIVGHNTYRNDNLNGTGVNTIKNLGTSADLFYGLTGDANAGPNQAVTIGAGTPWAGMSTDSRSSRFWNQGTIFVNSDFTLQGTTTNGGIQTLSLGRNNTAGTYSIVNNSPDPVRGFIVGNVALDENLPVTMPGNLTFVVTPQSTLQPNRVNSFGSGTNVASVVVKAAGTLDPGNIGTASATPTPGPVNANVTIESGGRLLLNDSSGLGSGGTITVHPEGVVELASQSNALAGISAGQFSFQGGSILRLNQDNVMNIGTAVGGGGAILQVFGANRSVTNQVNPFITAGPGTPNIRPESITIGAGGGITTDSNTNRQLNSGRGTIIFSGDAVIAGTTNAGTFSIQEDFRLMPGVTLSIGSASEINGNPKMGDVRFIGRASNTGDATSTIRVIPGQRLLLGTENTLPDASTLDLQGGASLVLDVGNLNEVVGRLTGTGTITATQGNAALVAGWGTTDFTFGGVFSNTGSQQPTLTKWGTSKMTLTGVNTSTGDLRLEQGEIILSGAGTTAFATLRPSKGATLTLDNTGTALNDRLGGKNISGQGGTVHLIGHASTEVNETIGVLNNSGALAGSYNRIKITPGAATTTLTIGDIQRFDNTGGRNSTFVFQTPTMANKPGTYAPDNTYTPNANNLTNGLVRVNTPRFTAGGGFDQQNQASLVGVIGSPLVATRPDLLADLNGDGIGDRFVTQEAAGAGLRALADSEYAPLVWSHGLINANVKSSGSRAISGESRVQSLTLTPGAIVNVNGTVPYSQQPSRLIVTSGGVMVEPGGTATIGGVGTHLQTNSGVSLYLHANGNLNMNAIAYSDTGIVKTGSGNLVFGDGAATAFRTQLQIDDGNVTLGANNRFSQTREQNHLRGIRLALNGGSLDLNGNSQVIDMLVSANALPYGGAAGGTLTSSTPATIMVQGRGGSSTFSGQITGAITLDKVGANTLLLTNNNTMTGATSVRGGTLQLREEGTLSNTSGLTVNYGSLMLDNSSLSNINNRVKAGISVDMRGGTIDLRGAAGQLSQQSFGTVNALAGQVTLRADAGGGGAAVFNVDNLTRVDASRAFVNFTTGFGFTGTAGNDTTAARFMVANINGQAPSLTNGMIGAWAIVNGDHFASYYAPTGIGALSNTADGYFAYGSGDLSVAASDGVTVNDSSSRTLSANKTVEALRYGNGGAATTLSLNAGVTLAISNGGVITNTSQTTTIGNVANQGAITSGANSLYTWINQGTTIFNAAVTGNIDLVKGGGGTLTLAGNNTHTGKTFAYGGTMNLGTANANGTTTVSIPGDLELHNATATVTVAGNIKETSNVTLNGDSILNLRDADSVTETLNSITFNNNGGGGDNRPIVSRAAARATSALNFTGANAITVVNDNAFTDPAMSVNLGTVNFTSASGPQIISVTSNSDNPIGLLFNSIIGTVPANPTGGEGGLIKTGNGVLVLTAANTFGVAPASLTPTFNIQQGIVHASNNSALGGSKNHLTTVQSGAGLFGRGSLTGVIGSLRFKGGSFLGATEGNPVFGVATLDASVQQLFEVLDDPSLATDLTIYAADYWIRQTNAATITINGKFTGSGTIKLVGPGLAQGAGGGGVVRIANPIISGAGSNDFSGTINVGTNTILESNRTLISGSSTSTTGSTLGSASIELNGGRWRIREDFSSDNTTATNQIIDYNHNVTLLADSFIDANRSTGAHTGNMIALPRLSVPSGERTLTVDSGNTYRIKFGELTGAGTLMKGGTSVLEIDTTTNFTGSLGVQGPQGVNVGPASNLILNAPTTVQNFIVNGAHTLGVQPLTVNGVLSVGSNAGTVGNGTYGVTSGSTTGGLAISISSTLNFGPGAVIRNDGVIGSTDGELVLSPSKIEGRGLYQTMGQGVTLSAPIADGATATALRIAGDSVVNVTNTNNTFTGGVEVLGGTLRIAPSGSTNNAVTAGTIKVLGITESALGENSQPVAANSATLQFDAGANTINHTGNVQNNGLLHVASGNVQISGIVSGSVTYVPGLLEGRLTGGAGGDFSDSRAANPGNFGIKLEPRMGQTNLVTGNPLTGWSDNEMWVYTGEFFDADGFFTFVEAIDDNVLISIDGVTRLLNRANGSNQPANTGPWNTTTSTAMTVGQQGATAVFDANTGTATNNFGMGPNNDGWHTIEIRIRNGSGGAGSVFAANFGIGLNTNGTSALDAGAFTRPVDSGDGSLFRTKMGGEGKIAVETGSSLSVGGFQTLSDVTLNGSTGNSAKLKVTSAGNNSATNFAVQTAEVEIATGARIAVTNLSVSAGGSLNTTGPGVFEFNAGTLEAGALLKSNGGGFLVNGSLTGGTVNVSGTTNTQLGVFGGVGTVTSPVTLGAFTELSPGKDTGILEFLTSLSLGNGFVYEFDGGNSPLNSDLVKLTGNASIIFAQNWTLEIDMAGNFNPTGMKFTLFDGDVAGASLANFGIPTIVSITPFWNADNAIVSYDPLTNDIILTGVVPEPTTATMALAGFGAILGMRRLRRRA